MPAPDWLQVDSLLPTLKEFQATSDAGTFHRRASSSITAVDKALTELWARWVKARTAPLTAGAGPAWATWAAGTPGYKGLWKIEEEARLLTASTEAVTAAKAGLDALVAACDAYILKQTGLENDLLDRGMGKGGTREDVFAIAAGQVRTRIAAIPSAKQDRVAPTLGLRYVAKVEQRRLKDWISGSPPQIGFTEAWAGTTLLPPLEIWKIESSGGPDKSWTLRSRSKITRVDDALSKWWVAFKHLDRDAAAGPLLDALIKEVQAYLNHKAKPKTTERAAKMARVGAAKRLLGRAKQEKERLVEWKLLVPPVVDAVTPLAEGETVDEFASGAAFMELRTSLPTLELWKEQSSVLLAIRSTSRIVELVDNPLEMFWKALVTKHRAKTLQRLSMLSTAAGEYLWHKAYKADAFRVDAVIALRRHADEEYERLTKEWPERGTELPPIVTDNDAMDDPEVVAAAEDNVNDLSKEIDPSALHAVGPADVARMMNGDTTGEAPLEANLVAVARSLNDRMTPWFGRSRCYAQILHPPGEASRNILAHYGREKKWVTRQMAAIQSCSLIKYPFGVHAAAEKKLRGKTPAELAMHVEKYITFFEKVVSVADHAARRIFRDSSLSAWKILDELGWTKTAPPLVLPMMSIITLLTACKWKESKTSTVLGGIASYGVKKSIVTGASLGMTVVTTAESGAKVVESMTSATVTNFAPSANVAAGGAGLSILGAVGAGISVPFTAYQIYKAVDEHKNVSTMLERFATLQSACPELADLIDTSPFFMRLRMALFGKLGRRQTRAKLTVAGGTAAIAGATTTTCVAVWAGTAVANIWNPVGWTLAGIGAVASFGLLIYKIKRRSAQEAALVDSRNKYNIPSFVKTKGEFDRYMIADLIFRAALNDASMGSELLAIGYALLYLVFGGPLLAARSNAIAMGHVGIMAFIKG